VVAILFNRSARQRQVPSEVSQALFSLTAAESRVFSLIGEGRSISDAARMLGVARSTIRTHLLQIFQKTGVNRQAEIVSLAASLRSIRF
jgi:DNA-binding CsgD family transcriptional regulator